MWFLHRVELASRTCSRSTARGYDSRSRSPHLVLLIACANIANLVLVRGMARRAETSIRMALGAQRRRLIRQMLTESVVLSCMGGLAGLAVAYAGRDAPDLAFPDATNLPIHASPSPSRAGFCIRTFAGYGPYLRDRSGVGYVAFGAGGGVARIEPIDEGPLWMAARSLVILQAALSLVLLVGAGLMAKSLNKLENQDFGVETAIGSLPTLTPRMPVTSLSNCRRSTSGSIKGFGVCPGWNGSRCRCTRLWREITGAREW